ncbi:MAG: hypothetical protein KIT09_22700 [Bryobacteraceae bacterium]|nr:hypothetical protein [Bryobacteraceae bacterium]
MQRFAVMLWLAALPAAAAWLRLESPHFELYTDAGEKAGRRTLLSLEQIRHAFHDLRGDPREPPLPTRIYLFASERDFGVYRPSRSVKGFYQGGPERNDIVLLDGEAWRRIAYHEYIHLALNHTSARLPKWFEEGLAEFYSTVEPLRDRLIAGKPIASHIRTLAASQWLDAGALAAIGRDAKVYDDHERVGVFYAQSWALVHMLHFAPKYRERLADYAARIADGAPAGEAFTAAFGRPLAEALRDLRSYVSLGRWPQVETGWTAPAEVAVEIAPLDENQAELALTDLQLQLGLWDMSERALRKLAAERGSTVEIETARGMVAMSRRDFDAAKGHLEQAIRLGSSRASTYFEYAMLLRETGAPTDDVAGQLRKTVELNPNYAEAHFLLGVMASAAGEPEKAVESLRRAAAILPRQANFWHALALACHESGRGELARRAARRALEAAVTEQEAEMARAAIRLAEAPPPVRAPARAAVVTPPSWSNPKGDRRIEGTLEQIDCLGKAARFHVRAGGELVELYVANPGEVLLENASSLTFEFSCGRQKNLPIVVEYIARPDAGKQTAGEVTAIHFR